MRRAPFVIAATAAGLAGVLTFHTRTSPIASGAPATSGGGAGSSGTSSATAPSGTSHSAAAPATGGGSGASATPGGGGTRSTVGPSEQYGYGQLAVKVTVSGSKITNASIVNLQTADQYSQQIAVQVGPMLRSQVLSAQSGQINGVSGATYTSEAFATSLQSALSALHVK